MAATAQLRRTQTKTETWSSIFTSSDQLSETQSVLFVKKLLAVAISSVTYLRAVFPERCFGDRSLEDLNLKILREEDGYPGSSQVIHWVKGCFDAIDRKYLRKIILGFYVDPSDPDTVIETYTFKFDYYKDGINIYRNGKKIASAQSAGETKRATIRLLRTLVLLTQTLKSLPDDVMMTMKILYYDDVTPSDYQPPGFKDTNYVGPTFSTEPFKVSVGDIHTPFHVVGLRVQSELHQLESAAEDLNIEEEQDRSEVKKNIDKEEVLDSYLDHEDDVPMKSREGPCPQAQQEKQVKMATNKTKDQSENHFAFDPQQEDLPVASFHDIRTKIRDGHEARKAVNDDEEMECNMVPIQTPNIPGADEAAAGVNTRLSTPATPVDEQEVQASDEMKVICSCGYNADDGLMILCGICDTWQHAGCYRCLTEEDCPVLHICVSCAKEKSRECTDETLTELDPITLQTTCLWRRALVACQNTSRLTAPTFAKRLGVESTVAHGLMKRMHNKGFLRQPAKGKRLGKLVKREKFTTEELKKYFNANEIGDEQMSSDEKSQSKDTNVINNKTNDNKERELERIVDKAAQIDISGKHNTRPQKSKASQGRAKDVVETTGKGRGRKRVISSVDKDVEFSISDSQDPIDSSQMVNPCKKRKASIATKAILI